MRAEIGECLVWLQTDGLRIVVFGVGSMLLIPLLRVVADPIPRLMPAGTEPVITEPEKSSHTLISLLWTVGTTLVLIVGMMMVLRELGFDITPLSAGAGVAGPAIGFGAQSLAGEIIAGFFIPLEDQFHVGDVI